jgi:hypothetical protein
MGSRKASHRHLLNSLLLYSRSGIPYLQVRGKHLFSYALKLEGPEPNEHRSQNLS